MKKFLTLLLAFAMVLSLAACGSKAEPAPAPEGDKPAATELNVGVFYYQYSDAYITTVRTNMDTKLTAAGVTYQDYDGGNNQANQIDQINTAITNGANLLVVNIVDTAADAAQTACDAAKAAGIPIIFFNREVSDDVVKSYDKCAFVGTNAPEAGHMQGEMIGDYLVANYDAVDLNKDGTISYVLFKGQEGNAEAEARSQYAVEDANTKLVAAGKPELAFYDAANASKYLVDQDGAWSAKAATDYMGTILSQYSEANKNMIELVIANNDGMAEGAIAGLQSAGYNVDKTSTVIPVYGVDAMDSAVQKINDGIMTGTVKQDGEAMAATIITLVTNVQTAAGLMDNTGSYNVDSGVAKIRVPYAKITG